MFEGLELAEKYLEHFQKYPLSTSLWTAGVIFTIIVAAIYSRWLEKKQ